MLSPFALLILAIFPNYLPGVIAETVEFFYNRQVDTCNWGSTSIFATNNTANGGLCAYVASTNRVYACPAPDTTCWTFSQQCASGSSTPGSNQIKCQGSGSTWCCSNLETCTVKLGQINVCISQFGSLNTGVSPAAAQLAEYSAIPSSAIATTAVTSLPSIVALATFSPAVAGTVSSNTGTTTASTATSTFLPTLSLTILSTASSIPTSTSSVTSSNSGLPTSAVAGIAIGVVLAIVLLLGAACFFIRSRRRRNRVGIPSTASPIGSPLQYHDVKDSGGQAFPRAEMYDPSVKPFGRAEMNDTSVRSSGRVEMHDSSNRSFGRAEMP